MKLLRHITLAALVLSGACAKQPEAQRSFRFVIVTHGHTSDAFWSVVANGARDAGRDMGVRVEYQAPARFDMVEMSNLIDAAVASKPDGLIVSLPDPAALGRSIQAAVSARVPVITINSGADDYAKVGAIAHVGQTEYVAGTRAGERLAAAGVRHALCINHEVGNAGQDQRCAGVRDALAKTGGTVRVVGVTLSDPDDMQQRIGSALATDAAADALVTLATAAAEASLAARTSANRANVRIATFDMSPRVLETIEKGDILFAIDQQQYLQGYLPVVLLTKYLETGALPGGGQVILTGPEFVTRENARGVIAQVARGVR